MGRLADMFAKLGIPIPDDKKAEVEAEDKKLETPPAPTPTPTPIPPAQPNQPAPAIDIAALVQQGVAAALAPVNTKLKEMEDANTALRTQLDTQQKADLGVKIKAVLDDAVKAGKIANDPTKIDAWKAKLEKDFDGYKGTIEEMAPNPALNRQAKPEAKPGETTTTQTTPTPADNYQQTRQAVEALFEGAAASNN